MVRVLSSCVLVSIPLALLQALPAQRDEQVFKTKAGQVLVTYGVVQLGKHSLDELEVGDTWRMGQGDPSAVITQLPILAGEKHDQIAVPGGHLAQLFRESESNLYLTLGGRGGGFGRGGATGRGRGGGRGGGQGGGQPPQGGEPPQGGGAGGGQPPPGAGPSRQGRGGGLRCKGVLTMQRKPAKKLQLSWLRTKKSKAADAGIPGKRNMPGVKDTTLRIDFGGHRLEVPMRVVLAKAHKAQKYQALGFTYPLDLFQGRLDGGQETVVLSLIPRGKPKRGEPIGYNVSLSKEKVSLAPMRKPPEGRRGRGGFGGRGGGPGGAPGRGQRGGPGQVEAPKPLEGTVDWSAHQEEKAETLTIRSVKVIKKKLEFEVVTGDQVGKVSVPMPVIKKKR